MVTEPKQDCPCPKLKCKRHGNCVECREHHQNSRYTPYCERESRTRLNENCPCPKLKCRRHGNCEACRKHHHKPQNPPYCERKDNTGEGNE
ncbi:MAG TPA: hypothetical protein VHP31_05665 [Caproicibacter sp.]|nr:hypothetical protein [Caproicibacter sp.]